MDINEYNKYKNDKVKFASKFFHATDPRRSTPIKVPLYDHQKAMLKVDDCLLIKKSRQVGISEAIAFEVAYHLNYTHDYNMLIYCPNSNIVEDMRNKVMHHFSRIPDNIRVGQTSTLRNTFATEINSCVEFRHGSATAFGRSQTYDVIYAEEVDFIKDFENSYQALIPCIARKGKIIITTTPNGTKTTFQRLWSQKNMFNKMAVFSKTQSSYNAIDEKSLNALSKAQYDKIIRECVIL